jgi:hypothetical protein
MSRSKVFISYSRSDRRWVDRLRVHLAPLERSGQIDTWDDSRLKPGSRWREEIRDALNSTKIAVLVVSSNFLASEFVTKNELPPLLTAAETDGAIIIPVIVSACLFEHVPGLNRFHAFNAPSAPLDLLAKAKQERALAQLAAAILDRANEQLEENVANRNAAGAVLSNAEPPKLVEPALSTEILRDDIDKRRRPGPPAGRQSSESPWRSWRPTGTRSFSYTAWIRWGVPLAVSAMMVSGMTYLVLRQVSGPATGPTLVNDIDIVVDAASPSQPTTIGKFYIDGSYRGAITQTQQGGGKLAIGPLTQGQHTFVMDLTFEPPFQGQANLKCEGTFGITGPTLLVPRALRDATGRMNCSLSP